MKSGAKTANAASSLKTTKPDGNNESTGTRRQKRKADELDKSFPATTKRKLTGKQSRATDRNQTQSPPKPSPAQQKSVSRKRNAGSRESSKPKPTVSKQRPPVKKKTLTEKERQTFNSLLTKVAFDPNLTSAIQDGLKGQSANASRLQVEEEEEEDDIDRPVHTPTSHSRRRSLRQASTQNDFQDDDDEDQDDGPTDLPVDARDEQERPSPSPKAARVPRRSPRQKASEKDLTDNEEDDPIDELDNVSEYDNQQRLISHDGVEDEDEQEEISADLTTQPGVPLPVNRGVSDDEQDVSFHDTAWKGDAHEEELAPHIPTDDSDDADGVPCDNGALEDHATLSLPRFRSGEVDESVIMNIAETLQKSVASEMQSSIRQIVNELRTDREQVNKLRDHISELTELVTTTATVIFFKQVASQPRAKELQRKLCLLPAVFSDHSMLKILSRVVIGFFVNNVPSGSPHVQIERLGVQFLTTMFFSRKPGETRKEKFSSAVGQFYSKLRYSLLTTSILAMQDNSFKTFRSESAVTGGLEHLDSGDNEEVQAIEVPSVTAMSQPFWLRPGYISAEHCLHASKKQEKRGGTDAGGDAGDEAQPANELQPDADAGGDNESVDLQESSQSSKQKLSRSGPLCRTEIATEAAVMVYKIITGLLYRSRLSSKTQLFHDVTYLFTGWKQHGPPVQQMSLKLEWEADQSVDVSFIDDMPRTKLVRPNARQDNVGQEVDKIDMENITQLETFIAHHPEFSVIVEHLVMVNGTEQVLKYRINLIEIVSRLLASYVTLESAAKAKDALCSDKRCLKAITVMAIGMRKLMEKAIVDLNSSSIPPWSQNVMNERKRGPGRPRRGSSAAGGSSINQRRMYKFESIDGMSLDQLLPSRSKQKELLNNMILTLTQEEYDARTMTNRTQANDNDREGLLGISSRESQIQADESQGVFRF